VVTDEVFRDITSRLVHESNWQEGIYLDRGRTRELLDEVFEEAPPLTGPRLDFAELLKRHRRHVYQLKRQRASVEEVATFNLSRAHHALHWIGIDLANRHSAAMLHVLRQFVQSKDKLPHEASSDAARALELVARVESSQAPVFLPLKDSPSTEGDLAKALVELDFSELLEPMNEHYIHFLHRITTTGILPSAKSGRFRTTPVYVGNPNLFFPPASTVPKLMSEYCRSFPMILPNVVTYDPIMKAAQVSHRFVRIHPYADGNGRISRLLMNLVLWRHHPPVYLKADKKGRHRYSQALRRADLGDPKPLACLVAMSLVDIYDALLSALRLK
jgi:fido (protein-threonine AMPylation protein)